MKTLINRQFIVLITAFFTLSITALSQTASPTPKSKVSEDDEVIKIDSRLVVVPVSITDASGLPVLGLTAQNFRVAEEGTPQKIERITSADKVPLEIALLFDVSASTDSMFKFELDTAAKFLQEVMKPEDRATIFTIGASPILVKSRDTAGMTAVAIRSITPTKELTAFFDTIAAATDYLKKNSPEGSRKVILVISDGEDTNSARIAKALQDGYKKIGERINTIDRKAWYQLTVTNRNDAATSERRRILQLLQNGDTVFYSINPAGSSFQLNKISVFGQENMQKFAEDTGGTAFLPKFLQTDTKDNRQNELGMRKNSELLDRIFRQLANELRSQYLIQYYSETDFPLNKYVRLDVGVQNRTDVRVRARQGYYVKN